MRRSRSSSPSAEACFDGPRDEPVLWLAGVVLPLRAVGVILGLLQREPLAGESVFVRSVELLDRVGEARIPAGVTASSKAAAIAFSSRSPPGDWQA